MHFFSKEHYFFGGHGIVGAQIGAGAGLAFAEQYGEQIMLCFAFLAMALHARVFCMKHSIWQ